MADMTAPPASRGPHAPACLELPVAGETMLLDPSGVAVLPESRALLVADLHLEKGSAFAGRRQYLPPYDTRETLAWQPASGGGHLRGHSDVRAGTL